METQTNGTAAKVETAALVRQAQTDGGSIDVFASQGNFENAQRMARALSSSSLVPESYRGDRSIPNVLIAMELAARIGASVFAVMQNIDIIHGRPSWRATFLIATVNASGRFTPIRFKWQGKEGTEQWGCRAVAKDRETGEECVGALITLGIAKSEGWSTKNGSKWKSMPEQMLMYRAAAFWARIYAPELSLGMHTSEELRDVVGDAVVVEEVRPPSVEAVKLALEAAETQPDTATKNHGLRDVMQGVYAEKGAGRVVGEDIEPPISGDAEVEE
jgi:hypothetical protein